MLQMKNIHKIYNGGKGNEVKALNGITLTVNDGDMVCIKGASGAGKSTLLHILGCLDKPSQGEYFVDDVNINVLSNKKQAKFRNQRIGFVLQHFALIEDESVIENIGIPLLFNKTLFDKVDKRASEMAEKLSINHLLNRKIKYLSGGEKQRVAIARALINNPPIILADEPTGALDTKNSQAVMDIFKMLNKSGKTIIIITHEQSVAERCNKIITMADGRVV